MVRRVLLGFIVLGWASLLSAAEASLAEEANLLIIRGRGIVAGVLPDAGGRLVLLRTETGKNWLDSNPADWKGPHPAAAVDTPFSYSLFGVTVWAGPQSAFWADQDLDAKRKAAKAIWPPDPFGEWGRAKVTQRSETEVTLLLPASPVTGLQMSKRYWISGEGELSMEVIATNKRDREVMRDIWPDVHVDPSATVEVPLEAGEKLRVEHLEGEAEKPSLRREDRRVVSPSVRAGGNDWSTKAFIFTSRQEAQCTREGERLLLLGSLKNPATVHPEHAGVEIYRLGGQRPRLEVEMHGLLQTLEPGSSMRFSMSWSLR